VTDPLPDVRQQFNRQAHEYASSVPHSSGESLQVITRLASEGRFGIGIDIATGPGFTAFGVAPFCRVVIATDIAPAMLAAARRGTSERGLSNVQFTFADAEALPFASGSLDLVTCRAAPHHFSDVPLTLREVARVLKRGGTYLLADTTTSEGPVARAWHQDMERRRDPTHTLNLPPSEWRSAIEGAGMELDFETTVRVNMAFNSWTRRSGTPDAEREHMRAEWRSAPREAVAEFQVQPVSGGDFTFSWPAYVCRARKSA